MRAKSSWALSLILIIMGTGLGLGLGYFAWGQFVLPASRDRVVIAIQPTEAASEIADKAKELESFLESRIGSDVEIYVPTTYAAVVESIRFGHAHAAFMGAWPSYIAARLANADIVLAEVRELVIGEEKRNEPYYFSYWVVLRDSPLKNLRDLEGKKVCFPSPISTSGYVYPLAKLVSDGLISKPERGEAQPSNYFKEVFFSGGYGQCWTALKSGQVDVSIIAGDVSETLYREVLANARILDQQGPIPSHAVVLSKDFKDPLRSKLIKALIELGKPEYRGLMRKFVSGTFLSFSETTTGEHVSALERALQLTGLKYVERFG